MSDRFDFEAMPRLETARLVLRPFDVTSDIDALYQLFADPEVARYTDTGPFTTRDEATEVGEWINEIFANRIGLRWAIALLDDEASMIGTAGFNLWDRDLAIAEIAYDLQRSFWGRGLMTEALESVIEFGFNEMHLNRIEANVTVGNDASVAVLTRLGFTHEGTLRERGYWKGSHHDLHYFGLLRSDVDQ